MERPAGLRETPRGLLPSNLTETLPSTDTELIERCRRGDADAFEELYRTHAGRVFGLASRMLGDRDAAQDLLQEVFLLAYRRLDTFRDAALSTWLHRIAVNRSVDHMRSTGAKMTDASTTLETWHQPHGPGPGSETRAVNSLDLERAIAELPDGYRAAFVLHDVEGLEHREAATALGIAVGTSKSQVHKARLRLRALLSSRTESRTGTHDA